LQWQIAPSPASGEPFPRVSLNIRLTPLKPATESQSGTSCSLASGTR
jgi:hypothetical protein